MQDRHIYNTPSFALFSKRLSNWLVALLEVSHNCESSNGFQPDRIPATFRKSLSPDLARVGRY